MYADKVTNVYMRDANLAFGFGPVVAGSAQCLNIHATVQYEIVS